MRNTKVKRLAELGLLTSLALIIFIVELQIPLTVPIPGVKLGLANIITVYGVYRYRGWEVLSILVIRILLGSVFGGNLAALPFSLAGGLLCLGGMLVLSHFIDEEHIWLASIFGAVLHNLGQTAAAVVVMGTWAVVSYLPFLMVSGCIAGCFTGIAAQLVVRRLRKSGKKTEKTKTD